MQRRWMPALLALAGAGLVAEAGVLAFWPAGGVVEPDAVAAADYFTPAQRARAADYARPQLGIYIAQTLLGLAVLATLVARPPRVLRAAPAGTRRVLARVAVTAAGLTALLAVVALPLAAVSRQRGIDVGLVTRSWWGWAQDVALGTAIQAVLMALTAVALVAVMRRLPRWWGVPASGVVVAGAVVVLFLTPVVLDPLFNRFTPVRGAVRADVLRLADRAGVDVGEVYSVDASRRTTAANAYVAGFGSTKRVVIYDTLLENFPAEERRFVIAHELAHQRFDDVPRGLLYVLLVAPFGLLAVSVLTATFSRGPDLVRPGPGHLADARTLPALALALSLVVPVVTMVSNQLSRRVEARADTFALQITDAPRALVEFRRRSAVRNVSEPDPSPAQPVAAGHPPDAAAADRGRGGVATRRATLTRAPRAGPSTIARQRWAPPGPGRARGPAGRACSAARCELELGEACAQAAAHPAAVGDPGVRAARARPGRKRSGRNAPGSGYSSALRWTSHAHGTATVPAGGPGRRRTRAAR
jgi:STE24 endopeptidase